jgi:hypothetical protein
LATAGRFFGDTFKNLWTRQATATMSFVPTEPT